MRAGNPYGQPEGSRSEESRCCLAVVRTTEEREAHSLQATVAAAAVSVWTAADGTPLYRVTRATRSMVTKMGS